MKLFLFSNPVYIFWTILIRVFNNFMQILTQILKIKSRKIFIPYQENKYANSNTSNSKNKTVTGECNRTYDLEEGERVDILATNKTVYGYFAVEGGFSINHFCNSVSTLSRANIGPNQGKKIDIKNIILFKKNRKEKNNYTIKVPNGHSNSIRILKGSQHDYFSDLSKKGKADLIKFT